MFRKNYFTFLFAAALLMIGSIAAYAQTGMARGFVIMKKADGSVVPVENAVIDIYRTDVKGKLPSGKTNKKGEFTLLGMLPGAKYALAISAPGIRGDVYPEIKAGDEGLKLEVLEGDGKVFTEDEVRQLLVNAPKTPTAELTAEQKKAQEEFAKKNAEITEKNKKIENVNAVINASLTEGSKAFNEKNYDLALAKYQAGIDADPDYEGTAPVLLNNKATVLISRAIQNYNAAIKGDPSAKAAAMESVKKDLNDSLATSDRALAVLKTANSTDAKAQKAFEAEKTKAYQNKVDGYSRLASMNLDSTKGKETLAALNEYTTLETDAAKKDRWQLVIADALREAGDSENAIVAYRKVLETSPDNPDALAGIGLSLFSVGASVVPENTAQMQEGLNYMQRFIEVAPDTHRLKAGVQDAVVYLKSKQLSPQKTSKPTKKKN